jgi:hypothetical protein
MCLSQLLRRPLEDAVDDVNRWRGVAENLKVQQANVDWNAVLKVIDR